MLQKDKMSRHANLHKAWYDFVLPDVHLLSVYLLVKVLQEGKRQIIGLLISRDNKAIMLFTKIQSIMLTLHNSLDWRYISNKTILAVLQINFLKYGKQQGPGLQQARCKASAKEK